MFATTPKGLLDVRMLMAMVRMNDFLDIFLNLIPAKPGVCDDDDGPPPPGKAKNCPDANNDGEWMKLLLLNFKIILLTHKLVHLFILFY